MTHDFLLLNPETSYKDLDVPRSHFMRFLAVFFIVFNEIVVLELRVHQMREDVLEDPFRLSLPQTQFGTLKALDENAQPSVHKKTKEKKAVESNCSQRKHCVETELIAVHSETLSKSLEALVRVD